MFSQIVLAWNIVELKSIEKVVEISDEEPSIAMKFALDNPVPLSMSLFEKLFLPYLNSNSPIELDDTLHMTVSSMEMANRRYRKTAAVDKRNKKEARKHVKSLFPSLVEFNATSHNATMNVNDTGVEEEENDELVLPPYVEKQEEEGAYASNITTKSKTRRNKYDTINQGSGFDEQKNVRNLPENLKIRIKVAYDQSFHNLMTSYNISPATALRYLSQILKQIFDKEVIPGLDTNIEVDVSSGNYLFKKIAYGYTMYKNKKKLLKDCSTKYYF